ncbi:hypothetical protein [Streptomyces avermitilis]|uniref:hypothetical protein n=1 Tax=Streptomyces avermitilis TaxID=33903 RepID=UPI00371B4CE1
MARPTTALVRRDPSDVVRRDLETRLMDESRQSSLSSASAILRKAAPPPALCGFLLLLALIFTVSYAVGAGVGPVAPGMHGNSTSTSTSTSGDGGGGGGGGMDDIGDMEDMQGGHG